MLGSSPLGRGWLAECTQIAGFGGTHGVCCPPSQASRQAMAAANEGPEVATWEVGNQDEAASGPGVTGGQPLTELSSLQALASKAEKDSQCPVPSKSPQVTPLGQAQ